jgi:hypothetical protein
MLLTQHKYNDDFTCSSGKHVISIIAQLSDSEIRNINSAASKTKSRTNGRGVSIFIAFSLSTSWAKRYQKNTPYTKKITLFDGDRWSRLVWTGTGIVG